MNTLTIQLEDNILSKLVAQAQRQGESVENLVAKVAIQEVLQIELMERFEAGQRQAAAKLTPDRIQSAFDEICALKFATHPKGETA